MSFDKWFYGQERIVQMLLLIIPFVGWVVECLVRLSVALNKKDAVSIIVFVLFLVVGWGWLLCLIDLIYLILNGRLILA
ncbi:MAG: hypothetical protein HFJ81_05020 [Clostridia bacterium]|nr:hypothetical protein [Clostridia bacterium]